MLLEWTGHLAIDHAAIDTDHKRMISLIDSLYYMPDDEENLDEIEVMFCDLIDAMSDHFSREEYLMLEAGYPKIDEHIDEHSCLLKTYAAHFYDRNSCDRISRQRALTEISTIIINHIKVFDRPLALYCKANQATAECA